MTHLLVRDADSAAAPSAGSAEAQLEAALLRLAALKIPEGKLFIIDDLQRIEGGYSRETWRFDLHWQEPAGAKERPCILQRSPQGSVLDTDRALEFRVIGALRGRLPVPPTLWLDADGAILGRPGFVVERLPGRPGGSFLGDAANVKTRQVLIPQFVNLAARLHAMEWPDGVLPFSRRPGRDEAAAAQLDEWEATFRRQAAGPEPMLEEAFLWLRRHVPVADRVALLWGDLKFENILFEGMKITAVLDWELAHLGDPMEDVAWAYRWFASTADILPLDDYLRRYEQAGGRINRRNLDYYALFTCVKAAVISLTGIRSFIDGSSLDSPLPLGSGKNRLFLNLAQFQRQRDAFERAWLP